MSFCRLVEAAGAGRAASRTATEPDGEADPARRRRPSARGGGRDAAAHVARRWAPNRPWGGRRGRRGTRGGRRAASTRFDLGAEVWATPRMIAAGERAPERAEPADDDGLEGVDQQHRAVRRGERGLGAVEHAGERDRGERRGRWRRRRPCGCRCPSAAPLRGRRSSPGTPGRAGCGRGTATAGRARRRRRRSGRAGTSRSRGRR